MNSCLNGRQRFINYSKTNMTEHQDLRVSIIGAGKVPHTLASTYYSPYRTATAEPGTDLRVDINTTEINKGDKQEKTAREERGRQMKAVKAKRALPFYN